MTKRKKTRKHRLSRLEVIERKCDLILSVLIKLRLQNARQKEIDSLICRLNHSAGKMRKLCERQRANVLRMYNLNIESDED